MREPRDPERIKPFLKKLRAVWKKHPDMRFWQLLQWIEHKAHEKYGGDVFFYEEDRTEEILDQLLNE